jgi:DNA-binding CsgD family transcriptional regulator
MSKKGELASLVGKIYESAMCADVWPVLLQDIARYMNSDAAAFRVSDVVSDVALMGYTYGHDESYMRIYRERVIHIDPFRPVLKRLPAGKFYPGQTALPYEELVKHEFYNELFRPNDLHYTLGGFAMREHSLAYQTMVQRGKSLGDFSQEEIDRFNRLIPHLQQSFRINRRMAEVVHHREVSELLLDKLSTGIVLCDAEGEALYLNRMAESLLSNQAGLSLVSGRFAATFSQSSSKLQQLINNALGKDGQPAAGGMSLVSSLPGHPLLSVLVAPVQAMAQERMAFLHKHACAVVFIGLPMQADTVDIEVVRMLYGLTEAEARLAAGLARGKSVEEVCSFYQISYHTGRSQLKSIFSKTGVSRQNELVNLILSSPAAL